MTNEELSDWTSEMCVKLGIPPNKAVFTLVLDEHFIMPGTDGCMVKYEVGTGIYHIMVNCCLLNDMERTYEVLERQMCCFREMPETKRKEKCGK